MKMEYYYLALLIKIVSKKIWKKWQKTKQKVYRSVREMAKELIELYAKREKTEGSYTTYLFEKGIDKILKKVGEECTEVIIAAKADDKRETVYEIADLAYHTLVLMIQMGISLEDIHKELASRHVIDKKVKQEKMT